MIQRTVCVCGMQSVVECLRVVWPCKAGPVCIAACCPGYPGLLGPASETVHSAFLPAPASPSDGYRTADMEQRESRGAKTFYREAEDTLLAGHVVEHSDRNILCRRNMPLTLRLRNFN